MAIRWSQLRNRAAQRKPVVEAPAVPIWQEPEPPRAARFPRLQPSIRRIRALLRPPRRLRFTRAGGLLTGAIVALGLATLNTGNNLLYLVLGALLGLIMVSGWLSEQVLRGVFITRRVPRALTAGEPGRITYEVTNLKQRLPTLALEIREQGLEVPAYLPAAWPGTSAITRNEVIFPRRGVYTVSRITLATSFPFGLFVKERDVRVTGTIVVWPRTTLIVRMPTRGGERVRRISAQTAARAGQGRGDYRSLRAYRPGDDPRDVNWRASARSVEPIVKEYERDSSETLWVCLDLRAAPGVETENTVEIAASLVARALRENERVGFATHDVVVEPDGGPGQLERILDVLARVRFSPDAPLFDPPTDPAACVLVAVHGGDARFGDNFSPASAP